MSETGARAGFRRVTKEQFWKFVMSTARNIHPNITGNYRDPEGYVDHWKDLRTGETVGFSADRSGRYELRADLA